jgi:hypothetical protein
MKSAVSPVFYGGSGMVALQQGGDSGWNLRGHEVEEVPCLRSGG